MGTCYFCGELPVVSWIAKSPNKQPSYIDVLACECCALHNGIEHYSEITVPVCDVCKERHAIHTVGGVNYCPECIPSKGGK